MSIEFYGYGTKTLTLKEIPNIVVFTGRQVHQISERKPNELIFLKHCKKYIPVTHDLINQQLRKVLHKSDSR